MSEQKQEAKQSETSTGMRFNAGKISFSMIPLDALVEVARVYYTGALKYARDNWIKGMDYSNIIDSLNRHWVLWQMGQSRDSETKCHHLAQVVWNGIALLVYELRGIGKKINPKTNKAHDDRTFLPIDESFNWVSGPAKEFELGLTLEEQNRVREKYTKLREEHAKAEKTATVASEIAALKDRLSPTDAPNAVKVVMYGQLCEESSQDSEGYPSYFFKDGKTRKMIEIKKGDRLKVYQKVGHKEEVIVANENVSGRFRRSSWPSTQVTELMFRLGENASLERVVQPFSEWHFEYYCAEKFGKTATKSTFDQYMGEYAKDVLKFCQDKGIVLDVNIAKEAAERLALQAS